MSCRIYKTLLSEYLEGTISDSERQKLESHLERCKSCKRELELLQNYKRYLSSVEQRKAPESIRENIWKSISEDSTAKQEERDARIIPLNLVRILVAASFLALVLIIPSFLKPEEITVNFNYQVMSNGKGPAEEAEKITETDPRASAILSLAEKLDCRVKNIYINPAGMADGMVVKVPKAKYDSFRQKFNSFNVSDTLPQIFSRSMRGSLLVQVYFPGRKFFTGDFDNDGRLDLGAYFYRGKESGEFFVAFNDGKDGFRTPVRLSLDDTLRYLSRFDEILSGDFNNDGIDDILIRFSAGMDSDRWVIYLNDGENVLDKGIECKPGEEHPARTDRGFSFTGDFNGDGYADIGIHYLSGTNKGRFLISYNRKDLSFSAPVEFITGLGGLPSGEKYTPLILDMNNDKYSDIILYWQEGERNAYWYVSENDKSGAGKLEYIAGFNKGKMAFFGNYLPFTGDIDGDGFDDLLVKNGTSDEVSDWYLMINDGDGSFTTAGHFIDFDGEIDLIIR